MCGRLILHKLFSSIVASVLQTFLFKHWTSLKRFIQMQFKICVVFPHNLHNQVLILVLI